MFDEIFGESLHDTMVQLPGQDLSEVYEYNAKNLFYFFKYLIIFICLPLGLTVNYNLSYLAYQGIAQVFSIDPTGWLTIYTSRNL